MPEQIMLTDFGGFVPTGKRVTFGDYALLDNCAEGHTFPQPKNGKEINFQGLECENCGRKIDFHLLDQNHPYFQSPEAKNAGIGMQWMEVGQNRYGFLKWTLALFRGSRNPDNGAGLLHPGGLVLLQSYGSGLKVTGPYVFHPKITYQSLPDIIYESVQKLAHG